MKRYMALLAAALVISCGGGGDGGGTAGTPGGGSSGGGGGDGGVSRPVARSVVPSAFPSVRLEESDAAVTLSGSWTSPDSRFGWSGGAATQSSTAGATATVRFSGNAIRWIGSRGRGLGKAVVRVDGGTPREVDLNVLPNVVVRTPIVTISDLSDGPHTLTIEVVSGTVTVDAFDVNPQTTVSHIQETDPNARFTGSWTKASTSLPFTGTGVSNPPELPLSAQETYTTGDSVTLPFRGTAISWVGYKGPDGGIATVQIDGGAPIQVDTYSATQQYQAVVFEASGLADTNHTITITATGNRNAASSAPRIVVDGFDVMVPGRRYEEYEASITYGGNNWGRNVARVWSEGASRTSNNTGATLNFKFNGTSVSWIGCRKSSAGGMAKVYIDGVLQTEVRLTQSYPIEGYQMVIFRADGLAPGEHTLTLEVTSSDNGPYVVVDAFDVHQ